MINIKTSLGSALAEVYLLIINKCREVRGGVKIFTNLVFILIILLASHLAVAKDEVMQITLSEQIQGTLEKASPQQKRKLEKSIYAGNKLISIFMNFSVYRDDETWHQRVGALIAMKPEELFNITSQWGKTLLVCPQIRLAELEQKETETTITYQTTGIGMFIQAGSQFNQPPPAVPYSVSFSPGKISYSMQLKIDAKEKLINVISEHGLTPEAETLVASDLKRAPQFRRPIYLGETAYLVEARFASAVRALKEIERAASEFCELK